MAARNDPERMIIIQGGVELVEEAQVWYCPKEGFDINIRNVVAPIAVPVRTPCVPLRFEQNAHNVGGVMILTENSCDRGLHSGQTEEIAECLRVQFLIGVDRLKSLCLRAMPSSGYLAGNVERRYAFSHTYRDYVIRAFNEDKPYDRFIVEQLAADQLPMGDDKSALAALGFVTLGRRFLNNQNDIIDDRIDVVTRGLMGLTVSCARCHDHKFDPIPTADYYSLHGVFFSSEEPTEKPLLGPLVESPAYEQFLSKRAELETKIKGRETDEVKKFLSGVREKTGDYLLAVHDLAALPKTEKMDLFAGPRKLNVEVLKRWQPFLAERAKANDPVLAPWFALAALPETEFAEKAAVLVAEWKESGARSPAFGGNSEKASADGGTTNADTVNADVLAAFAKAEKPLASLKDAAAIYNVIFAKHAGAVDAPTESTPDQRAIRELLFADNAPSALEHDEVARMLKRQIDTKTAPLKREIEALNWTEPGAPLRAMALADKPAAANTQIFLRGNPANRGAEAPRQFLEVLATGQRAPFKRGSGRLDLAEEIVDPKNPLTARVMVNRVWGWHFGDALVRTPSDLGVRTEAPVQRALLDWLAASFVEQGWSVKQLHRSIVLSSTYRQSSDGDPKAAAADPDNRLVHRFNRRRLELEALRDTLLAVSGTLDRKAGGIPDDLTKEPFATRRTVYGFIDRQNLPGMFRTFDYPNPDVSSSGRFATTVPQQALFMMNSGFALEQARQLVQQPAVKSAKADQEKITALYRVVYQRPVERDEMQLALEFVRRPANAMEARQVTSAGWQYGQGRFDEAASRVRDFQLMTVRKDGRVSPAAAFPDEKAGRLSVTATGGHPGKDPAVASIRRWNVPGRGRVKIEGTLGHANPAGDGVRGRIVSSEGRRYGEWTVHNTKAETKLELEVHAGGTLDFVVDGIGNPNSDGYTWAPIIAFTPDTDASYLSARTWNAKADFDKDAKPVPPLTRWEALAQVLLLSNELAFVD